MRGTPPPFRAGKASADQDLWRRAVLWGLAAPKLRLRLDGLVRTMAIGAPPQLAAESDGDHSPRPSGRASGCWTAPCAASGWERLAGCCRGWRQDQAGSVVRATQGDLWWIRCEQARVSGGAVEISIWLPCDDSGTDRGEARTPPVDGVAIHHPGMLVRHLAHVDVQVANGRAVAVRCC